VLKITTFFKNRVTTSNLIFRDTENKGVNIIYYPELGTSGVDFINKYRKKNYWDYIVIPQAFMFLSHKVLTNNYYKDFKKNLPMVRVQRKFIKVVNEHKSVVVDLTALNDNFTSYAKSRSKKQTTEAFIRLVEQFAVDAGTEKQCYLIVDNAKGDEKEMVDALYYISRLTGGKLRVNGIEGIALYGNNKFWPLTTKETDKDGDFLKINLNIFSRYMKDVTGEEVQKEEISTEDSILSTKETVKALYQVHKDSFKSSTKDISGTAKKADTIEENPLELIKNEVISNKNIKGKSFEEKLSNLFKEKPTEKQTKKEDKKEEKIQKIVKDISKDLLELNKQHNGVIELNEKVVKNNRKSFYDPFKIIGFNDFSAYNKQDTEFWENLDQSMFDLIKSIEKDKGMNIKVHSINTSITDTNRDRYKTYKIKLQHKDFGYTKPYTVSFHVPIPSKGKYLKLGGNDWIMLNQFFPKPVVKTGPEMVKLYTHYNTLSVFIKTHSLNADNDVKELVDNFGQSLKRTKKLNKKPEKLSSEKAQYIIDKYNLPGFINNDVFVNLEIK